MKKKQNNSKNEIIICKAFIVISVFIFFSLSFYIQNIQAFSLKSKRDVSSISQDTRKILEPLPNQEISLDVILAFSLKSNSFKLIQSKIIEEKNPIWKFKQILDWNFYSSILHIENNNEILSNSMSPEEMKTDTFSLGISKRFISATNFKLELTNSENQLFYGNSASPSSSASFVLSDMDYNESKIKLEISQSLWKDSFGYSSRRNLKASEILSRTNPLEIESEINNWTENIVKVYYNVWLAKNNFLAAQDNVYRQEQLYKVTKIKARRGTAEKPDVFQVKSALILSQENFINAKESLQNIWRSLVISLDLPKDWLTIDASEIPIDIGDPFTEAKEYCDFFQQKEENNNISEVQDKNIALQIIENQMKASSLAYEAAKNQAKPDLSLFVNFSPNGIDGKMSGSLEDATTMSYPYWMIGLSFAMPLNNYQAKANLATHHYKKIISETALDIKKQDLQKAWINNCIDLKRLVDQYKKYQEVVRMQKERVSLEQRRFNLGRIPVFNVIQAGNDVTNAELLLSKTAVDARQTAWKIFELNGVIKNYLENIQNDFKF